jgi:hypothetical protein
MGKGARLRRERGEVVSVAAAHKEARRKAAERGAAEGEQRGCLFCRQSDGGFSSAEHILPESLGNKTVVLPAGVVCDRCNNGTLANIDEALGGFLPIEMMKTWQGIPSKAGKLPEFKFDNGTMRCRAPGDLFLALDSAKGQPGAPPPTPPSQASFAFSASRRKDTNPRRLRNVQRALLKMAVEFAWLDLGEEVALGPDFDPARERVLSSHHGGYLIYPEKVLPREEIEIQYMPAKRSSDGHPLVGVGASFWGIPIFTDSLFSEPQREFPSGWNVHRFAAV